MKDELTRRISAALDSADGLAGDPALQTVLRGDPEAAKYVKDLARLNKWLAVWPLPEPDDATFEALARRIEQRLDESLPTASDPTSPPVFDDDDALRDSTASLLQPGEPTGEFSAVRSGEFQISDSQIELITGPGLMQAPIAESRPVSPIARVTLNKQRMPQIVEEVSSEHASGEPKSAAELELRLDAQSSPGKTKKTKTQQPGEISSAGTGAPIGATRAKDERISIPTPQAQPGAPTISPVIQLPKRDEPRTAATFWWFAAAAAVGLGAFGAATFYEDGSATTVASTPTAAAPAVAAFAPAAVAPFEPSALAAAAPSPSEPIATRARPDTAEPMATARAHGRPSAAASGPMAAPMRMSSRTSETRAGSGGGGSPSDSLTRDALGSAAGATSAHTPSIVATTPSPAPPPSAVAPTPRATTATTDSPTVEPDTHAARSAAPATPSELPDTPDRGTIQAVLAGRLEAVRACAAGAHGVADVDIVIASSGRITTATVNGPFAGTPVGSCIARAVRGAQFPAFTQPRFEVTYPYHL